MESAQAVEMHLRSERQTQKNVAEVTDNKVRLRIISRNSLVVAVLRQIKKDRRYTTTDPQTFRSQYNSALYGVPL